MSSTSVLAGDATRVPVTRDTWVSSARGEEDGSNGGEPKLKTKSYQEMTLFDLDPAALRGRVIERATLHFRHLSGSPLTRATVSSVATPWSEGRARGYERELGAASFRWAETGRRAWTQSGGDLSDVVLSAANTRWSWADATPPDEEGWQSLDVEPAVLATRVAGIGFGFLLFDDVGSEYTRDGDKFAYHPFPNRFIHSREAGAGSAPYWTVELGAIDTTPPTPIESLSAFYESFEADGIHLVWITPPDAPAADEASSGTVGFLVRYSTEADFAWATGREVGSDLVPQAGRPGLLVHARLKHLALPPRARVHFAVRAVDAAGNVSAQKRATAWFTGASTGPDLVRPLTSAFDGGLPPLALGETRIAILDELDKIELNAKELPLSLGDPAHQGRVTLVGGGGEWLGLQLALQGPTAGLRAAVEFGEELVQAKFYVARGVNTPAGRFADPLEPWDGVSDFEPGPEAIQMLFVDLFVVRDHSCAHPETELHSGTLSLSRETERLDVELHLSWMQAEMSKTLAFVPEMNAYDSPPPPYELEWYRLAHEHRTNLNVLRYNWQGRVHDGCGPKLLGPVMSQEMDWTDFDARFGPLLDGSAFKDGSRGPVPVEMFYLPLNENWPVPIERHFQGGYWADTALDKSYWQQFKRYSGVIQQHIVDKHWSSTTFEFYLNNKLYHKGTDWQGSSAPWIFDEPMHTQDFHALRCFGQPFMDGYLGRGGFGNLAFRVDVSRPQWQRDILDGLVGVNVVGSAFERYRERVLERKRAFNERLMLYATANKVELSNVMPAAWCIDAWLKGADGVIPWQTIGKAESWKTGDAQALMYPPRDGKPGPPSPSLRLKAFRRGQQDVQLLASLTAWKYGDNRDEVARRVRALADFTSNARARYEEDAGELEYPKVTPRDLANLRMAVRRLLAEDDAGPR